MARGSKSDVSWCEESGKKSFATKKSALGSANATGKLRGVQLSVYKCPHCKQFHITKNTRERAVSGGSKSEAWD